MSWDLKIPCFIQEDVHGHGKSVKFLQVEKDDDFVNINIKDGIMSCEPIHLNLDDLIFALIELRKKP